MANSLSRLVIVGLSTEQILTAVVIVVFLLSTRWNSEVLGRMKNEFFPQPEANLSEIMRRLEAFEAGEYAALLGRGLNATLTVEFRLCFVREAGKMDQLHERLEEYEKELIRLSEHPEDSKLKAKLEAESAELKGR